MQSFEYCRMMTSTDAGDRRIAKKPADSRVESLRIDTRAENAVTRDSLTGSTETHRSKPLRGGNTASRRHEAEYSTSRHRATVGPDQAVPHTLRIPKRSVVITCDRTDYRLITYTHFVTSRMTKKQMRVQCKVATKTW